MSFQNAVSLLVCSVLITAVISISGMDSNLAAQKKKSEKSKTAKVSKDESSPKSKSKKTTTSKVKSDRAARMEKQKEEQVSTKSKKRKTSAKSKAKNSTAKNSTVKSKPNPKSKQRLPRHFAKLELSEKQKSEVYALQSKYSSKLKKLRDDLEKMRSELNRENRSVLTKTQIKTLDKLRNSNRSSK